MNCNSLRIRLLTTWALFIVLSLNLAGVALVLLFERAVTNRTEIELTADLRQLARGMVVDQDGALQSKRPPTDPQFDIIFGGRYWQVLDNGSAVLKSASLDTQLLPLPKAFKAADEPQRVSIQGPQGQSLFGIARRFTFAAAEGQAARQLLIATAVDDAEIKEDVAKFSNDMFWSMVVLAALLLLGAFAHITVGLKPLQHLHASVSDVRDGRARRVEGNFPDEVMPLVTETNELLAAKEIDLANARKRAGDLAHGLKTPLAIMSVKSRQIRKSGEVSAADDIDRQIDTMNRHVERELARARARGTSRAGLPRVDASALLRELVSAIQALPRNTPIEWSVHLPERLEVSADSDDFLNMSGNLLENAHKWAQSKISVMAEKTASGVAIEISDDGPGIPLEQTGRVLMRGVRADTSVSGSGLGLAIVSDFIESYKGELLLSPSPLGGLAARVTLPDFASEAQPQRSLAPASDAASLIPVLN